MARHYVKRQTLLSPRVVGRDAELATLEPPGGRARRSRTEAPYLIDPMMLGQLYLGSLRFEADSFTGFRKNLTTLRIETKALYHVR